MKRPRRCAEAPTMSGIAEQVLDRVRQHLWLGRFSEIDGVAPRPHITRDQAAIADYRPSECEAGHERATTCAHAVVGRLEQDVARGAMRPDLPRLPPPPPPHSTG